MCQAVALWGRTGTHVSMATAQSSPGNMEWSSAMAFFSPTLLLEGGGNSALKRWRQEWKQEYQVLQQGGGADRYQDSGRREGTTLFYGNYRNILYWFHKPAPISMSALDEALTQAGAESVVIKAQRNTFPSGLQVKMRYNTMVTHDTVLF